MKEILHHQTSTGLEHAGDLSHGLGALHHTVDVVKCETRQHDVERRGIEGQVPRVACDQFDPIGDCLDTGVLPGCLGAIAQLVLASPEINPNGPAGRETLRGPDQQQTTTTADVEDELVTTLGDEREEPIASADFADLAPPDHRARRSEGRESAGNAQTQDDTRHDHMASGKEPVQHDTRCDRCDSAQCEIAHDVRRVDSVVGALPADGALIDVLVHFSTLPLWQS
jgi:hypothetical protein